MLVYLILNPEVGRECLFVSSVRQTDKLIVLMFHDNILVFVRGNRHGGLVSASDNAAHTAGVLTVQSIVRFTRSAVRQSQTYRRSVTITCNSYWAPVKVTIIANKKPSCR